MPSLKEHVEFLSSEIRRHNDLYYLQSSPEISDAEYDMLFDDLRSIENSNPEMRFPDSPTQKLSIPVASTGLGKVRHDTRMLSIGNTFEEEGVAAFNARMRELSDGRDAEYSVEPKFDGLAVSLIYRNGKLVQAATRGDYEEGENVTANAFNIPSIPKTIPYLDELDVRGEVMMTTQSFMALNAQQRALGEKEYANARNAASGALRLLDATETGRRGLVFSAYSITDKTLPDHILKQDQALAFLRSTGFPVDDNHRVVRGKAGIDNYFKDISERRHALPFDIDGIVIKINDLSLQERAGYISREPKAMLAYKFNQQEATTTVSAIDIQIGRTGALTPVARLAPIALGGVVVSNATLHNINEINRMDIRIGDTVVVRRNGDVIPGIISVDKTKRTGNEKVFHMPGSCPCCKSPVEKDKDEDAVMRCTGGLACDEQAVQNLIYFVSRPAMNIDGVGESLCRQLFKDGLVRTPDQLYDLTSDQIMRLEGYGRKSADNVIEAINASRSPALRKFLVSLGIRNAGEGTAKRLEAAFGDINIIRNATSATLSSVRDIGNVVGSSLYRYFRDPSNIAMLDKFERVLKIQNPVENSNAVAGVSGKTFVITGTLEGMSRDEAKTWIESMGGITSGSVSKKTHFLLAGEAAGSKLDKANELGVKVISLDDLKAMTASDDNEEAITTRSRMKM